MRLEINMPDPLFDQAQHAAAVSGLSVERFVLEAVQLQVEEPADDSAVQQMFTPERLARIAEAQSQIEAGLGMSPEAARAEFAAKRAEWLRQNPK